MTKIAIYTNQNLDTNYKNIINDFFEYDDIVIFSSVPQVVFDPSMGVVSSYYMPFFDGILIFTEKTDLEKYIRDIKTEQIFLLTENNIISINKKEMINGLQ